MKVTVEVETGGLGPESRATVEVEALWNSQVPWRVKDQLAVEVRETATPDQMTVTAIDGRPVRIPVRDFVTDRA